MGTGHIWSWRLAPHGRTQVLPLLHSLLQFSQLPWWVSNQDISRHIRIRFWLQKLAKSRTNATSDATHQAIQIIQRSGIRPSAEDFVWGQSMCSVNRMVLSRKEKQTKDPQENSTSHISINDTLQHFVCFAAGCAAGPKIDRFKLSVEKSGWRPGWTLVTYT